MGFVIDYNKHRDSEPLEDDFLEQLDNYSCLICRQGGGLDPFRYVIDNNEYEIVTH